MNCVDWEERIAFYAGGDLAAAEAREVERHVAECAGCSVLLSGLRESLALVREAHAEPVEAAHLAAVRARVLAELERAPAWRWRFAWVGAMGLAALVVLAVAIRPQAEQRLAVPMPQAPAAPAVARTIVPPHPKKVASPRPPQPQRPAAEPMVVKLLTNDPNVVIYWITDTKGE